MAALTKQSVTRAAIKEFVEKHFTWVPAPTINPGKGGRKKCDEHEADGDEEAKKKPGTAKEKKKTMKKPEPLETRQGQSWQLGPQEANWWMQMPPRKPI